MSWHPEDNYPKKPLSLQELQLIAIQKKEADARNAIETAARKNATAEEAYKEHLERMGNLTGRDVYKGGKNTRRNRRNRRNRTKRNKKNKRRKTSRK